MGKLYLTDFIKIILFINNNNMILISYKKKNIIKKSF